MTDLDFIHNDGGRAAAGYAGSTGDCVTRAISIALQQDYEHIRQELMSATADFRRTSRKKSARKRTTNSVFNGVPPDVYRRWLENRGWTLTSCQQVGHPSSVRMIADHLPRGRIIVRLRKHLVAVIDHTVHDTHRSHTRAGWTEMPNGAFLIDQGVQVPRTVYGYWTHLEFTKARTDFA